MLFIVCLSRINQPGKQSDNISKWLNLEMIESLKESDVSLHHGSHMMEVAPRWVGLI